MHAATIVPLVVLTLCAAAVVQHRAVLGANHIPWALFLVPTLIGTALGLLLAWALAAQRELQESSRRDVLTGALNRLAFDEELRREIARATRYGSPFGVLLFDVDHFKDINDTCGHATGDRVLVEVSRIAAEVVRTTDHLSRWGGDEFALVAPSTGLPGARVLAEKVRATIAAYDFEIPGLRVTVSVGMAQYVNGDDPQSIVERADEALYRAKRGGRNCAATMRCLRPATVH